MSLLTEAIKWVVFTIILVVLSFKVFQLTKKYVMLFRDKLKGESEFKFDYIRKLK